MNTIALKSWWAKQTKFGPWIFITALTVYGVLLALPERETPTYPIAIFKMILAVFQVVCVLYTLVNLHLKK